MKYCKNLRQVCFILIEIDIWLYLLLPALAETVQIETDTDSLEKNLDEIRSLEEHLDDELPGQYIPFPMKNRRLIELEVLNNLESSAKETTMHKYKNFMDNELETKSLDTEEEKELKDLTRTLWNRGVWPNCGWVYDLPPKWENKHKHCTKAELKFLVDNSRDL